MALRCKYCDGSGFGYDHHPDSPTEKVKCWHCSGTGMEEPPHPFVADVNTCADCGENIVHHKKIATPHGGFAHFISKQLEFALEEYAERGLLDTIAYRTKRILEAHDKALAQAYKDGYRNCELEFIPKSDRKEAE